MQLVGVATEYKMSALPVLGRQEVEALAEVVKEEGLDLAMGARTVKRTKDNFLDQIVTKLKM